MAGVAKVPPSNTPFAQRRAACRGKYEENAAGKLVRKLTWRKIDLIDGELQQFDDLAAAFEFDERHFQNGTCGKNRKFPIITEGHIALTEHVKLVVEDDGDKTRTAMTQHFAAQNADLEESKYQAMAEKKKAEKKEERKLEKNIYIYYICIYLYI